MKNLRIFLLALIVVTNFCDISARKQIIIHGSGQRPSHSELPLPADEPEVYYDNETQEIIIDGMGFVSYYDVEITSMSTSATVLTTQVGGSYDTIDISSLPGDDYLITIDTPLGNTYEGYFDTY